jgi:hypothetical protein
MVHVVVPGKILMFDAPCPHLPPGRSWQDVDGERRFSADFYAELLHDLGVTLVVRADAAEYDAGPFARRGIAVEPLDDANRPNVCSSENPPTLQALDRFIALLNGTRGSLAIHCRGRGDFATTLLAAYLLRHRVFADPAVAVAWLAIARPGGLRAPVPAEDLRRALPPRLACALRRSASFDDSGAARVCGGGSADGARDCSRFRRAGEAGLVGVGGQEGGLARGGSCGAQRSASAWPGALGLATPSLLPAESAVGMRTQTLRSWVSSPAM